MQVLLYSPKDFENVCVVSCTLESFGVRRCSVYDPHRLIRPRYGKSRTRTLKKVSAGAFFKVAFERVEDLEGFLKETSERKVAAVADPEAGPLTSFRFRSDDVIVFGSEGAGLPPEVLSLCEERVTVPRRGVTQSLNLGVASGIVLYEFFRQEV